MSNGNDHSARVEPADSGDASNPSAGDGRAARLQQLQTKAARLIIEGNLFEGNQALEEALALRRSLEEGEPGGETPHGAAPQAGGEGKKVTVCRHHRMVVIPNNVFAGLLSCGCVKEQGLTYLDNALPSWVILRGVTVNGQQVSG